MHIYIYIYLYVHIYIYILERHQVCTKTSETMPVQSGGYLTAGANEGHDTNKEAPYLPERTNIDPQKLGFR